MFTQVANKKYLNTRVNTSCLKLPLNFDGGGMTLVNPKSFGVEVNGKMGLLPWDSDTPTNWCAVFLNLQ